MDNVITLNYNKPQTFEFQMTIQGLDSNDVRVFMGIDTKEITLCFKCERKEGDNWVCKVPVLKDQLNATAYPFYISAVIDGYFFEPVRGTCNVSTGPEIYVKKTKNASLDPAKQEDTPEEKSAVVSKDKTDKKDKKVDNKSKHPITVRDTNQKDESTESPDAVANRLLTEKKSGGRTLNLNEVVEKALSGISTDSKKAPKRRPVKEGKKDKQVKEILAGKITERKTPDLVALTENLLDTPEEVVEEGIVDEKREKVKIVLKEVGIQPRKPRRKFKLGIDA